MNWKDNYKRQLLAFLLDLSKASDLKVKILSILTVILVKLSKMLNPTITSMSTKSVKSSHLPSKNFWTPMVNLWIWVHRRSLFLVDEPRLLIPEIQLLAEIFSRLCFSCRNMEAWTKRINITFDLYLLMHFWSCLRDQVNSQSQKSQRKFSIFQFSILYHDFWLFLAWQRMTSSPKVPWPTNSATLSTIGHVTRSQYWDVC